MSDESESPYPPQPTEDDSLWQKLRNFISGEDEDNANGEDRAENLAQVVQQHLKDDTEDTDIDAVAALMELRLIRNILNLTRLKVEDVMIPRADIVGIEADAQESEILKVFAWMPHNRLPVYRKTLDDIVGMLNLKDVATALARREKISLQRLMKQPLIVAPSRAAMALLVEMRTQKQHVALIVDEYGGIDGMVTQGRLIEAIVGDISGNGEHDKPQMTPQDDGTVIVDARLSVREFEETYGDLFPEDEHEDIDTMGGLVMAIAGKMPLRGELLKHEKSGLTLEVLDADPRRVKRLRMHGLKAS